MSDNPQLANFDTFWMQDQQKNMQFFFFLLNLLLIRFEWLEISDNSDFFPRSVRRLHTRIPLRTNFTENESNTEFN